MDRAVPIGYNPSPPMPRVRPGAPASDGTSGRRAILLAPALTVLLCALLPRPAAPQFRAEKTVLYEDFPDIDYVFAVPKPVETGGQGAAGRQSRRGQSDEPVDPVTGLTEAEMIFLASKWPGPVPGCAAADCEGFVHDQTKSESVHQRAARPAKENRC